MTEFDLELEDIYNQIMYYPNKIYEIFCDFFGEEHVDLQNVYNKEIFYDILKSSYTDVEQLRLNKEACIRGYRNTVVRPYILVWFPKLKITNEYDESVEVEDLWAKINITYTGKMHYHFQLNRSTYQKSHILSDYQHSHVCGIDFSLNFSDCCLGTGPIKNTCSSLQLDYDESLWQLFCFELSKYVQTESIAGVPYRRMSSISNSTYSTKINNFFIYRNNYGLPASEPIKEMFLDFTKDFLKRKLLKFNYFNDSYGLGMSFLEYIFVISNYFIEWYNEKARHNSMSMTPTELYTTSTLVKSKILNNSIYLHKNYNSSKISSIYSKLGTTMFHFKGRDVVLNIIDDSDTEDYTTILNIEIATAILNSILKTLNINYE